MGPPAEAEKGVEIFSSLQFFPHHEKHSTKKIVDTRFSLFRFDLDYKKRKRRGGEMQTVMQEQKEKPEERRKSNSAGGRRKKGWKRGKGARSEGSSTRGAGKGGEGGRWKGQESGQRDNNKTRYLVRGRSYC